MKPEDIADEVEFKARFYWQRQTPYYGPLCASWVGWPKPTARRLALLVQSIIGCILKELDCSWSADLGHNTKDRPTALILSNGVKTKVIRVRVDEKLLRIGETPIGLTNAGAGRCILKAIADECGAFFGETA